MTQTVWNEAYRSWYKDDSASGNVTALWPGSTLHYLEAVSQVRYNDWEIKNSGSWWAYLGNGCSQTVLDTTADVAFYIRKVDDGPLLGWMKELQAMNNSGTMTGPVKTSVMVQMGSNL